MKKMSKNLTGPIFILFLGAITCSSAIIMIKASKLDPVLVAGYRLFLAGIFLLPLYLRDLKKSQKKVKDTLFSIKPGIVLGVHFITWVIGCRMTYAANATLIVNMVPAVMPFILYFIIREVLTKREVAGSLCAVSGIVILMMTDFQLNEAHFRGDLVCLGSMTLFALYLVLSRKYRNRGSIWLYTVPLYISGGFLCFIISACRGVMPWDGMNLIEGGYVLLLAVLPTIVGHSALNYSMKVLRGQLVGVLNLSQFVFAAIYGYIFFAEVPGQAFYIAVLFLVGGIYIVITGKEQPEVENSKECTNS